MIFETECPHCGEKNKKELHTDQPEEKLLEECVKCTRAYMIDYFLEPHVQVFSIDDLDPSQGFSKATVEFAYDLLDGEPE
jgi:hypothetical protein